MSYYDEHDDYPEFYADVAYDGYEADLDRRIDAKLAAEFGVETTEAWANRRSAELVALATATGEAAPESIARSDGITTLRAQFAEFSRFVTYQVAEQTWASIIAAFTDAGLEQANLPEPLHTGRGWR